MTDLAFKVAFGPVVVQVASDPALSTLHRTLEEWFSAGLCALDQTADLSFRLLPAASGSRRDPSSATVPGRASPADGRLTVRDGRAWEGKIDGGPRPGEPHRWEYTLRDGPLLRTVGRLPAFVFRFLHVHYFTQDQVRASTFLYRHLIPAVQMKLLEHDATFVHASALRSSGGGGMMVSGWGGAGKTSGSAALYMGAPDRWGFMSDDLAILDSEGTLHFSPLPLNVFPYSTLHFEPLHDRVVRPMSPVERLQWILRGRVMGQKGVARRVPPWDPPPTGTTSSLDLSIHLRRAEVDEPRVRACRPGTMGRICGSILLYELRQSLSMYAAANASCVEDGPVLPAPYRLALGAERIVTEALRNRRLLCATIPERYGVEELGRLLERLWEGEAGE